MPAKNFNRNDPKGYYALLGVTQTASIADIKTVFRQRAMELHPDRNQSPCAIQHFQELNTAFEVLSNPDTRAQYDISGIGVSSNEPISPQDVVLEPISCSCCGKVTAQPRYLIFYEVKSFIFVTIRSPIQGIFCHNCAEKKLLRSTVITWLLGWWGFPWGLIYSPIVIFHNLFGGSKPSEVNARLLIYQAWVFATQNKLDLARSIAVDANSFSHKIKKSEGAQLQNLAGELLSNLETGTPIKRLQNVWSLMRRPFYIQSTILTVVVSVILGFIYIPQSEESSNSSSGKTATSKLLPKTKYVRPSSADNGALFPSTSDYIDGYPVRFTGGYSTVTIDNAQNNSDVFVKLFSLDIIPPEPGRVFFIRAREAFTVENVKTGNYDIRYRDLNSGGVFRTDRFNLQEVQTVGGVQFSKITLSLYKIRGGNMKTHSISENEF